MPATQQPSNQATQQLRGWVAPFYVPYGGKKLGPYFARCWKKNGQLHKQYIRPEDLENVQAACQRNRARRKRQIRCDQELNAIARNLKFLFRLAKRAAKGNLRPEERHHLRILEIEGPTTPARPPAQRRPILTNKTLISLLTKYQSKSKTKGVFMVPFSSNSSKDAQTGSDNPQQTLATPTTDHSEPPTANRPQPTPPFMVPFFNYSIEQILTRYQARKTRSTKQKIRPHRTQTTQQPSNLATQQPNNPATQQPSNRITQQPSNQATQRLLKELPTPPQTKHEFFDSLSVHEDYPSPIIYENYHCENPTGEEPDPSINWKYLGRQQSLTQKNTYFDVWVDPADDYEEFIAHQYPRLVPPASSPWPKGDEE